LLFLFTSSKALLPSFKVDFINQKEIIRIIIPNTNIDN